MVHGVQMPRVRFSADLAYCENDISDCDPPPIRSLRAPTYSFNHPTVQRIKLGAVKSDLFNPCMSSWKRYDMDTVSSKPPEEHSQNTTTLCLGLFPPFPSSISF